MKKTLEKLSEKLKTMKADGNESYSFSLKDFEKLQDDKLSIRDLIVNTRMRWFGSAGGLDLEAPFEVSHSVMGFELYGYKDSYRYLAYSMLSLLFSDKEYVEIELSHPKTEIKKIYIHFERYFPEVALLKKEYEKYTELEYFPRKVSKFPFSFHTQYEISEEWHPGFYPSWSEQQDQYHPLRDEKIDQMIISLDVKSLCQTTELFLDMALDLNEQSEVCLEVPRLGFGGVNTYSYEARFWLPNSFAFDGDDLDKDVYINPKPSEIHERQKALEEEMKNPTDSESGK